MLLAKGPFILLLSFFFFIGMVVGFFLTLSIDPFVIKIKESPFGPELASRLPSGNPFNGLREMSALPREDREKYVEALNLDEAGKLDQARAVSAALVAANPKHPLLAGTAAWFHLKSVPRHPPQLDMAAAMMGLASASNADNPWLNYVGGILHEKSGRSDSALARYLRAIRISPQFAYAHAALGRLQLDRGETGLASASLRKAIGLMVTHPEKYRRGPGTALPAAEAAPFDWLATLYMQVGAADSARMALEYGQEMGWKTDRLTLVQGWLWEASGFLPKADSVYRALVEKDPANEDYARALVTLGWKPFKAPGRPAGKSSGKGSASQGQNNGADAIFALSLLDPMARQNPGNAALWMALGQAYYHRGLYGMATECFDSSLKAEPGLPGLAEKRELAYQSWSRESAWAKASHSGTVEAARARRERERSPLSFEEQTPVVLPGAIALLGTYSVPWGSTPVDLRRAYPAKTFRNMPGGNLMDEFDHDGVTHQYLLAFKEGHLWGVRIFVTDSAGVGGDLFGRLIRIKTKISGEGKGTGEAACPGFIPFQGAIWETDDTFEFMAQFSGKENQIRLVRMDRNQLPQNRRLCDLVPFLKAETWDKGGGPSLPTPRRESSRTRPPAASRSPVPMAPVPEARPPRMPSQESAPSIVVPPGVDPYKDAPSVAPD